MNFDANSLVSTTHGGFILVYTFWELTSLQSMGVYLVANNSLDLINI